MGTWREILRFAKHPKSNKQRAKEEHLKQIWSHDNIFLRLEGQRLHCHPAPNPHFLPKDLANNYRAFKRPIQDEPSPQFAMLSDTEGTSFTPLSQGLSASLLDETVGSSRGTTELHAEDVLDHIINELIPNLVQNQPTGTSTPIL